MTEPASAVIEEPAIKVASEAKIQEKLDSIRSSMPSVYMEGEVMHNTVS
jgi:hypothetical protein